MLINYNVWKHSRRAELGGLDLRSAVQGCLRSGISAFDGPGI